MLRAALWAACVVSVRPAGGSCFLGKEAGLGDEFLSAIMQHRAGADALD